MTSRQGHPLVPIPPQRGVVGDIGTVATELFTGFSIPFLIYTVVFLVPLLLLRLVKCPRWAVSAIIIIILLVVGGFLMPMGVNANSLLWTHNFGILWGSGCFLLLFIALAIYVPWKESKKSNTGTKTDQ